MEFKCRICGGQVKIDRALGICICEYCGTKQTLPQFTDENSKRLFDSGNHYLQHSEYDKAEAVFNRLLSQNPQDAELYWDLVLCKYGVTFVCDPRTEKYVPTCNRTHYDSVLNDKNYQNALNFSSGEKNEFYRESAATIHEIQKGIVSVAKKEKPFDIFISYKETDANGNRTKDSVVAQELYEKLVAAGYKVFFSRITLEDKIGSEYEPYIYAALSSSKIMLTVSSSKENIDAPWVKNEWSRFLTLRQADASKTLIPLFLDMSREELPAEFEFFSAQDISKSDYEQDLIRGIKKLIPLPVMLAAKRKKRKKQAKIIGITAACVILVSGAVGLPYIKDYVENIGNYNSAMELYNNGSYDAAKEAFAALDNFKDAKEMMQSCGYEIAMQLYYDGDYPQAAWAFRDMNGYEDSVEMQKKAENAWREGLATVAAEVNLESIFERDEKYYVSENGSAEAFTANGNANKNIRINEHGVVVSIAENYELYALYEDGYVLNSAKNNAMEADWNDVIQITPVFNSTNIALQSSGNVIYGDLQNDADELNDGDMWLEQVYTWNNIVALSYDIERSVFRSIENAAVLGVCADGSVKHVFYQANPQAENFLDKLSGIKKISLYVKYDAAVYIAAIDKSGVVYTFSDGQINQYKDLNIIDIAANRYYSSDIQGSDSAFFAIHTDRSLTLLNNENIIMEDVVYLDKGFVVTRSGRIYTEYNIKGKNPTDSSHKTRVLETWLERK